MPRRYSEEDMQREQQKDVQNEIKKPHFIDDINDNDVADVNEEFEEPPIQPAEIPRRENEIISRPRAKPSNQMPREKAPQAPQAPQIIERAITMELLNEKLNFIINLLSK